jgi:uncharacterized Zn finger protein
MAAQARNMKTTKLQHFELAALRDVAGEKVFSRGEAYHRDGLVEILVMEALRVVAQVAGTEDYRRELTGRGKTFNGHCSCSAFEDWGFCKHLVATALTTNAMSDATEPGEHGELGALARIRAYLREKNADSLATMILDIAERDPALFRKLDAAATAMHGDDKTLESGLRRAIDAATRTRGLVEYREARAWTANVDGSLDLLQELVTGGRAEVARRLAEHALDRIVMALGSIDDSDGHCGALLERARDIHLAAARATRPEPVQLARNLFAREIHGEYDTFHGAAALYSKVLGKKGLAEYRRLAAEAWGKLPPRSKKHREAGQFDPRYGTLRDILDFFAERDHDVEARIALRTKDLTSPWNYFQLAEFCRSQGREQDALRWAEDGLWLFEDDQLDERLVFFAADLFLETTRKHDAVALLWRAFEKAPSLEIFARLRELGGASSRDRAIGLLERRCAGKQRATSHRPSELLVELLMREKMFDEAWTAVRGYGASLSIQEALSKQSEATHPREALEFYARQIEHLAELGGSSAYAEAAQLVARMGGLQSRTEHDSYVASLKARFGRRRTFIKLFG